MEGRMEVVEFFFGEFIGEFNEFIKEWILEKSDRVVTIVGCAFLEDLLRDVLKRRVVKSHKSIDKEIEKSIDRLGAKKCIELCYATGMLTGKEAEDLINIFNIRHEFAHNKELINFDDTSIRIKGKIIPDICKSLMKKLPLDTEPRELYKGVLAQYIIHLKYLSVLGDELKEKPEIF